MGCPSRPVPLARKTELSPHACWIEEQKLAAHVSITFRTRPHPRTAFENSAVEPMIPRKPEPFFRKSRRQETVHFMRDGTNGRIGCSWTPPNTARKYTRETPARFAGRPAAALRGKRGDARNSSNFWTSKAGEGCRMFFPGHLRGFSRLRRTGRFLLRSTSL